MSLDLPSRRMWLNLRRFAAPSQPEKLEARLYSPFASILQNEVSGMVTIQPLDDCN